LATVVTPNLPEAAALLGDRMAESEAEAEDQARRLLALGPHAVLVKGGHGTGPESTDLLVDAGGTRRFTAARLPTGNTHGTGCTLSSAIAAQLARGARLDQAVAEAKAYLTRAIAAADQLAIGRGAGPVHHFHGVWP
jgi:hydroxymethylpyrimidine/phosphomethylpyrimidine kinase